MAGQYMKMVKAFDSVVTSIVGSECVTEEGLLLAEHSVFLFLLPMLLYAIAVKVSWLKDHEVAERPFSSHSP